MKKFQLSPIFCFGALLVFVTVMFCSCDSDTLSARLAKNALEREAMFRDSSQVVSFDLGYYEIKAESRATLQKLVKAGMITCKISEVNEHHRFEKYTWWSGTKVYYKDVIHYFADVALTDEGKKYIVSNPPTTRKGDDLPDSASEAASTDEVYAVDSTADGTTDTAADSADAIEVPQDTVATAPTAEKGSAYAAALAKVKVTSVWCLVGFYKVNKVKDIFCPESYVKEGMGNCHFTCTLKKLTPFGKILTNHKDNEKISGQASLVHYLDKGWQVDNMSLDDNSMNDIEKIMTDK